MTIAFASGKGGTGKTAVSTNFSAYLAQRSPDSKIRLLDFDVEEPNSGLFIKGYITTDEAKYRAVPQWDEQACILCNQCTNICNFNALLRLPQNIVVFPQLCHSCYACSELCPTSALPMANHLMGYTKIQQIKKPNIEFVETKLEIGEESATPLIREANNDLEKRFEKADFNIIDAPPGTSCSVIEATELADQVFLVTEPTPFGLHDLKLAVRLLRQLKKPFSVILNKAGVGNKLIENYCEQENIHLVAKLNHNRELAHLYSKGKLFFDYNSETLAFFENIFDYISNKSV